jgi:hypothetical protein
MSKRNFDMVRYDPQVIQEHAQRLYDRAMGIIIIYGVGLGLLGLLGGALLGAGKRGDFEPVTALLGGLLFGALGVAYGQARGFELRLQAQTALCQVQIEVNGRPPVVPMHPGPGYPPR